MRSRNEFMQPDFKIGDYVLWIPDGDIGLGVDVDHFNADEPFNIEWYINPSQSGWHSAFGALSRSHIPAMVRLGG